MFVSAEDICGISLSNHFSFVQSLCRIFLSLLNLSVERFCWTSLSLSNFFSHCRTTLLNLFVEPLWLICLCWTPLSNLLVIVEPPCWTSLSNHFVFVEPSCFCRTPLSYLFVIVEPLCRTSVSNHFVEPFYRTTFLFVEPLCLCWTSLSCVYMNEKKEKLVRERKWQLFQLSNALHDSIAYETLNDTKIHILNRYNVEIGFREFPTHRNYW